MKKILLLALVGLTMNAMAQTTPCVPDESLMNEQFGLWPDTTQNLPEAYVDVYYEEYVQIKTPSTVGEVPGAPADYEGIPISEVGIDSIGLIETIGMPAGMQMTCSTPSCVFEGNSVGCVNLFGTPTEVGVYDLSFKIDGWIAVFGQVVSMSSTGEYVYIDGYKLIVNGPDAVEVVNPNSFSVLQNIPNPFTGKTTISYNVLRNESVEFKVYDMMGSLVKSSIYAATNGTNKIELSAADLNAGIYFYTLSNGEETISKRMVVAGK